MGWKRPTIQVNDRHLRDVASDAYRALGQWPGLFDAVDAYVAKGFVSVGRNQLRHMLAQSADWVQTSSGGLVHVSPPASVVAELMVSPAYRLTTFAALRSVLTPHNAS